MRFFVGFSFGFSFKFLCFAGEVIKAGGANARGWGDKWIRVHDGKSAKDIYKEKHKYTCRKTPIHIK